MIRDEYTQDHIADALSTMAAMNPQATDGRWLEDLAVEVGPFVKDWDVEQCYQWSEWPERGEVFPTSTSQDLGIDVVAIRRSDQRYIAIQCKSRQLDPEGRGTPITKGEIDSFANTSSGSVWAERWIVTNGDVPLNRNARPVLSATDKPIKMVNIAADLAQQQPAAARDDDCPHCPVGAGPDSQQTKSCMQNEAVAESIRILREHELHETGGSPMGQARGRLILPCGTGKTRISLRIVEALTPPGELSVVLCPSIALVAQIRREYLENAAVGIRALAVCSDETAGYNARPERVRNTLVDPTADTSNVSAAEVKGQVTTDPQEIAGWIRGGSENQNHAINVIFGTYQSSHRIAEALQRTNARVRVLVGDEAHRTAGLRKNRRQSQQAAEQEQRVRDFTLCHDHDAFPATYRLYQTATPRVYDTSRREEGQASDWIVRSMDDETTFGVELYRKSYVQAVNNGWLSDYQIIALGINDREAYAAANELASGSRAEGGKSLTTTDYLRGLALALTMGGAVSNENGNIPIRSCIAFMNTVKKSQDMAAKLQTDTVRDWVQQWLDNNANSRPAMDYTLEHLDATSNVTARDNAKRRLAQATGGKPHGVINVGIFGEGTDAPSLNAVAFLESRKSPIDVIQAVGRAMRTAPGKERGYIICPVIISPNVDPEVWLSTSEQDEGWQELGQILLALRAHDQRIEENLEDLLRFYIPPAPEFQRTIVAIAKDEDRRMRFFEHEGVPGQAQRDVERVMEDRSQPAEVFSRIGNEPPAGWKTDEPTTIIAGKKNSDGSLELRMDSVARTKPTPDGTRGPVDVDKSKIKARNMVNRGTGVRLTPTRQKKAADETRLPPAEQGAMRMLLLSGMQDHGNAIRMNLLSKSGLVENRVVRDLNILEASVAEAAHHLRTDQLSGILDRHFGLHNLDPESRGQQADGCTIAALLMMNAAMLHQRISNGGWLSGISDLSVIKNDVGVVWRVRREWERIMRHDFRPVLEPAVEAIYAIEESGKMGGLERALHHLAAEAERIAETYAGMGADHAGPLFNRVMGNQASDGAYFTRPTAASIAARLTLDACGDLDWSDEQVWRDHRTVDLACGSGTLLAAILTDMKRRAAECGADEERLADLQKLAVEDVIKGLDFNPVSLQLAASQLTAGNREIRYRQMGLHQMPYGPRQDDETRVAAGTLELLGQKAIIPRPNELAIADERISSQSVWAQEDAELEDAVSGVKDARIVIMNPPFSSRRKMGEKFPPEIRDALRRRVDSLEGLLIGADVEMAGFGDKNAIRPLFVALAEHCLDSQDGVLTMINPTTALSASSGLHERRVLAERYHIHTVLTCHQPRQINMSQETSINESIVVARRHHGPKPPTRFINIDRMPLDENEVDALHRALRECYGGLIADGWGEVSWWPADRMEAGDWTPAVWRSPELAEAAWRYANDPDLLRLQEIAGLKVRTTVEQVHRSFEPIEPGTPGSFPILKSKGANGQASIQSTPDEHWIPKNRDENSRRLNGGTFPEADQLLEKAAHLLVTSGQRTGTARLTATASDYKYVGSGWMPVIGLSAEEAKAAAVFVNSTPGRLQLLRHPGRTIDFPRYNPADIRIVRVPDIKDLHIRRVLSDCWERTKDMVVPQFRDGECQVRVLWDNAVAEAMGWDADELTGLRGLLHDEPHVCGFGYNEYGDEVEEWAAVA